MKTIGFELQKGFIRYCVLEGTFESPRLIYKGKESINPSAGLPQNMDRFESIFVAIITEHVPDKIGYRLSLAPKKEQIHNLIFPYGILNLICLKRNIPILEFVKQNFSRSKFGFQRDSNIYDYCDYIFGQNPPFWDEQQKIALLASWLCLKEQ